MAKFPVESQTEQDQELVDAVNYLLSGPTESDNSFDGQQYFTRSFTTGALRIPSSRRPFSSQGVGADGATTVQVLDPGVANDPTNPPKITAGQYVTGINIGAGCRVDVSYVPGDSVVPLTAANVGPVRGYINFNDYKTTRLYVAPITISTITYIDSITIQVNFAAAQPTAPFELGQTPTITGSTAYNGFYATPGVVECTTTYAIIQNSREFTPVAATGGTIEITNMIKAPPYGVAPEIGRLKDYNGTDVFGVVSVSSNRDRVTINSQISNVMNFTVLAAPTTIYYVAAINRYRAAAVTAETTGSVSLQGNNVFSYDDTVSTRTKTFEYATTGNYTTDETDQFMLGIIDQPGEGTFMYRLDLAWVVINTGGDAEINWNNLYYRSVNVQLVKE